MPASARTDKAWLVPRKMPVCLTAQVDAEHAKRSVRRTQARGAYVLKAVRPLGENYGEIRTSWNLLIFVLRRNVLR